MRTTPLCVLPQSTVRQMEAEFVSDAEFWRQSGSRIVRANRSEPLEST
jgi:hypothetical protein